VRRVVKGDNLPPSWGCFEERAPRYVSGTLLAMFASIQATAVWAKYTEGRPPSEGEY
jgi:hypothetical protein